MALVPGGGGTQDVLVYTWHEKKLWKGVFFCSRTHNLHFAFIGLKTLIFKKRVFLKSDPGGGDQIWCETAQNPCLGGVFLDKAKTCLGSL